MPSPLLNRQVFGPKWETPAPKRAVGSYGPVVRRWARRELGITFGRWQAHALDSALRHDRDGNLVHRIALISTARQNGKSVLIRAFYGWLFDVGRHGPPFSSWTTILAAAHDAKQARIVYRGVFEDLGRIPRLTRGERRTSHETGHVPPIVKITLQQGIRADGLMLDTVTSEPGSARGLSAGAIAWDEMLTQRDWDMWEALSPTQSAQRSPIMILTSTAGHADSVILRSFFDRLRRQASGDEKPDPTFYGAWWQSDDPDAALDWQQIRQANPALGDGRLTRQLIVGEHAVLPPDSWRRERLNHFVEVRADGAFNPGVWAACRLAEPLAAVGPPFALGVDVQPGWQRATICAAGVRSDGRVGVEVVRDIRGAENEPVTAARIIAEIETFPERISSIAYDRFSGAAGAFARHEAESGLPWQQLTGSDIVSACMDVDEMIRSGRLAVDDRLLDAQIGVTARRSVGQEGAFRFSRAASLGPIDAVMAMTLAAHAAVALGPQPKIT